MMEYVFFYDESEHSRKINRNTVLANNFAHEFVGVIVGFDKNKEKAIEKNYIIFESIYQKKFSVEELKSEIIKSKQLKHGFASLQKTTKSLVRDYLNFLISNNINLYYSIFNKIEYIIYQLFSSYHNIPMLDINSLRYSITKILVVYHPLNVYEAIYDENKNFVAELKQFIQERIVANQGLEHKSIETQTFEEILMILDNYQDQFVVDWDYKNAFIGFKKYLAELGIKQYSLTIDRDGNGNTYNAAKHIGIENVCEQDSKESFGVRMADMLAGIISKFLKNINSDLRYKTLSESKNLKLLSENWFYLDEDKLFLYKLLNQIISKQNNAWYKSFVGIYADKFIYFVCLLNYFSGFENMQEFEKFSASEHSSRLNQLVVGNLFEYFTLMHSKLLNDYYVDLL